MKIGIYIGSFNPPHKGHIYVVNYLINENVVDKVLIVPTQNYWDKQDLIDLKDRINMLKYYENNNIKIDTVNNNYPYTYELMRELKKQYSDDLLYLVIGADNIVNFNKWKSYQELLEYNIIVMNRDDIDIDKYIKNYPNGHFIILRDFHPIEISSTELRKTLDSKYLDNEIIQYVKKHHLYR